MIETFSYPKLCMRLACYCMYRLHSMQCTCLYAKQKCTVHTEQQPSIKFLDTMTIETAISLSMEQLSDDQWELSPSKSCTLIRSQRSTAMHITDVFTMIRCTLNFSDGHKIITTQPLTSLSQNNWSSIQTAGETSYHNGLPQSENMFNSQLGAVQPKHHSGNQSYKWLKSISVLPWYLLIDDSHELSQYTLKS